MTDQLTGIDAVDAFMFAHEIVGAWTVDGVRVIVSTAHGTLKINASYTPPPDDGYPCLNITWTPQSDHTQ